MFVSILRNVAQSADRALADGRIRDVLALEGDFAAGQRFKAGESVDEFGLSVAIDTCDTDDLARANVEGDVVDSHLGASLGGDGHVLHLKDYFAGMRGSLVNLEADITAYHHAAQFFLSGVLDIDCADIFAAAKNGAAVRDSHDLIELVGDEQDRLAFCRKVLHDHHEIVDLGGGQHGGGLVEDEDLVVSVEHLEDLCALLHTDSDILYFGIEVDLEAVFLRQFSHFPASFILLQDAVFGGLSAEDDVVENGEALHEHEMLVDHSDSQSISVVGIVDLHLFAVLLDDAFFGLVHAEQHRHQRGLSCAVFPKQRVDLALPQLQSDIVIRNDSGKSLCDVQHLNCVFRQDGFPLPLGSCCPRYDILP